MTALPLRAAPEIYRTRADTERALWAMALDGRADCNYDRRYRALVLLAAFASLRWGEATALRRCDIDLGAGAVRVRAAYAEGPRVKSSAARPSPQPVAASSASLA